MTGLLGGEQITLRWEEGFWSVKGAAAAGGLTSDKVLGLLLMELEEDGYGEGTEPMALGPSFDLLGAALAFTGRTFSGEVATEDNFKWVRGRVY